MPPFFSSVSLRSRVLPRTVAPVMPVFSERGLTRARCPALDPVRSVALRPVLQSISKPLPNDQRVNPLF